MTIRTPPKPPFPPAGPAKPKRKETYNEGANDERSSILAKVRRMVKDQPWDVEVMISGTQLIAWLLGRNERYNKKAGGLGRR